MQQRLTDLAQGKNQHPKKKKQRGYSFGCLINLILLLALLLETIDYNMYFSGSNLTFSKHSCFGHA